MKIEPRLLSRIRPYDRNPRHHAKAVDAVARSLQEFGFRQPIVVDANDVIIVGHTRYEAALQLGLATVPVHVAADLTPEQAKAYRLADNRLGEIADWDLERLSAELAELNALDFDLDLLGFDGRELASLLEREIGEGNSDPDDIPEPPDEPTTCPGDIWLLGEHRLLCGDAGIAEHVSHLVGGQPIHLVHSDPPYNVCVKPRSNNAIAADPARDHPKRQKIQSKMRPKDRPLINDFRTPLDFDRLLRSWFGNLAQTLLPGHCFYLWGGYANCANYPAALRECGLYFSQAIIWHKQHPVLTRKDYMGNHEWAFYGWREGAPHRFFGPHNETDVWSVKKITPHRMLHLTEKPVELAVRAIQNSSRAGENILDLFGGSGSTLIAAEQTGRRAYLMELDSPYCDVIVHRWERFTGQKAVRKRAATCG